MEKGLLIFVLLGSFMGIFFKEWSNRQGSSIKTREVITTAYSQLDQDIRQFLDKLQPKTYDPRRSSVSILNYISEDPDSASANGIPLNWDVLVNTSNKTELGLYWLYQHPLETIILMRNGLSYYKVAYQGEFPLLDDVDSITGAVDSFFEQEVESNVEYAPIHLSPSDFELNFEKNLAKLSSRQRSFLSKDIEEYRYFKEGILLNVSGLAHYEVRFYESQLFKIHRVAILHRIARAWFRFTNKAQMKTWIAHGSLLGYYFNGLIMPWDNDLDVQMTTESFWKLVKHNNTLVIDYEDDVTLGKYLIDVNPWFIKRERNPDNKIDARFIDVESGLYIDITVLTSEISQFELISQFDEKETQEFYKVFNPQYDQILTETEQLALNLDRSVNKSIERQELISCKDYHFYTASELSPLIPTIFEGEIAYVPNNIQNLLAREYRKGSIHNLRYMGFEFDRFKNLWTHESIPFEYNDLIREFVELHREIKQTTFKRHIVNKDNLIKFPSFRVDPWIKKLIQNYETHETN